MFGKFIVHFQSLDVTGRRMPMNFNNLLEQICILVNCLFKAEV